MMLAALVMAMVDIYPGMPTIPSFGLVRDSLFNVLLVMAFAIVMMALLSRYLLKVPMFNRLVAVGASGGLSDQGIAAEESLLIGEGGLTVSPLRPGGKARFGEEILDVISQGEMIQRSRKVRVIGFSGKDPIVELVEVESGRIDGPVLS